MKYPMPPATASSAKRISGCMKSVKVIVVSAIQTAHFNVSKQSRAVKIKDAAMMISMSTTFLWCLN